MNEVEVKGLTDGKLIIELNGDIDSGKADFFYNVVNSAYVENPASIVFECSNLNFIDSTTLGTFVKILKQIKVDGFKMTLKNLHPKIKKLFMICSLNTIMEIE